MATIGYRGALGGMAKDAIKGAGNALVGGLKGAVLREMPAVTAGMAFGKELSKRANAPKMQPGGTPPPTSTSSAMGGFGASVSLVAGQNKSNVISLFSSNDKIVKFINDCYIMFVSQMHISNKYLSKEINEELQVYQKYKKYKVKYLNLLAKINSKKN